MRLLFFVLIIVIFIIFIWGCLKGTKATPKLPLYTITAKNKTCKYTVSLHYDIFSSHELWPILHVWETALSSLHANRKGTKKQARITIFFSFFLNFILFLNFTKKIGGMLVLKLVLTAKSVLSAI